MLYPLAEGALIASMLSRMYRRPKNKTDQASNTRTISATPSVPEPAVEIAWCTCGSFASQYVSIF